MSKRSVYGWSLVALAVVGILVGCTGQGLAVVGLVDVPTVTPVDTEATAAPCALPAIVVPTPPAEVPGSAGLDPTTGLHMTGTPQEIDLESYRLRVTGLVERPLELTYDELRCLPKRQTTAELVCPGFFVDEATWAGAPIGEVLALAGVKEGATKLRMESVDGYSRVLTINEQLTERGLVAYEWEGEPLPILHGFPVRAVLPEISGGNWIKWLVEIEVL